MTHAVHPFDLPVDPRMVLPSQPMFDSIRLTNHIETHLTEGVFAAIAGLLGELKSVVRQDCMDLIRNNLKQVYYIDLSHFRTEKVCQLFLEMLQELPRRLATGRFHQPRHREFAGSVNSAVLVYIKTYFIKIPFQFQIVKLFERGF